MILNKANVNQRDRILFGEDYDPRKYFGGIRRFSDLDYKRLKELFRLDVIDPEDRQNYAPNIATFMEFLHDHAGFTAEGYAVSPERNDYRVSLEGVNLDRDYTLKELRDFVMMFRSADEFSIDRGGLHCWYD